MEYTYYPGCSLEGSAREYDASTRALMDGLGVSIREIEDWTCCGASAADAVSRLLSLSLPARNLALAAAVDPSMDILVPCSACYLNLKKAADKIEKEPKTRDAVNAVLEVEDLKVSQLPNVRHLLDILVKDIGAKRLAEAVKRPLSGLVVAPYYGCQCLRPYAVFDDPEEPRSMEPLIRAAGADLFSWDMGGRCCGASHMTTKPDVGMELVGDILEAAAGADVVVTVCPMCQMNLEAYQKKISARRGNSLSVAILYLPQLLGLSMGLPEKDLRLGMNLAVTRSFREKLDRIAA